MSNTSVYKKPMYFCDISIPGMVFKCINNNITPVVIPNFYKIRYHKQNEMMLIERI